MIQFHHFIKLLYSTGSLNEASLFNYYTWSTHTQHLPTLLASQSWSPPSSRHEWAWLLCPWLRNRTDKLLCIISKTITLNNSAHFSHCWMDARCIIMKIRKTPLMSYHLIMPTINVEIAKNNGVLSGQWKRAPRMHIIFESELGEGEKKQNGVDGCCTLSSDCRITGKSSHLTSVVNSQSLKLQLGL